MKSRKSFFIEGLDIGIVAKKPFDDVVLFTFHGMEQHCLLLAIRSFSAATSLV